MTRAVVSGQCERVQIAGHNYLVCAECRCPMQVGHNTIYDVPIPGKGMPGPTDPDQALCDPCYRAQYQRVYPKARQPHVHGPEYHPIPGLQPVPYDVADRPPHVPTDIELFEEALAIAKASNGAEKPEEVLARLKGPPSAQVSTT